MSISQNFPNTRPSLNLNFARSKTLDPRITFTRTSTGTYVDESGVIRTAVADEPRFDHDPATGECLGLLIEEERSNLVRNNTAQGAVVGTPGTNPTNSYFFISPSGISREITSIGTENGITYFDVRYYGTSTSTGEISWAPQPANITPVTAGQTVTSSVYLKYISGDFTNISNLSIRILDYGPGYLRESSTSYATSLLQSSIPIRYTHTRTTGADTTGVVFSITLNKNASGPVDVTLRIGMPQIEIGSFATSVIPTSGSTATRTVDSVSMTGTNFSSWYNPSEGTIFANFMGKTIRPSLTFDRYIAIVGNDPNLDEMGFYTQTADGGGVYKKIGGNITNNANGQFSGGFIAGGGGPDFGGKAILAYKTDDAAYTINGATPITDNTVSLPTFVALRIFGRARYQPEPSGHISQLLYYPTRLSNSQLQTLTK